MATSTLVSVAESIGARPGTPAAHRAVLERIEEAAPRSSIPAETSALRLRCEAEKDAAADQRHQQALREWQAQPWQLRQITARPIREYPDPPDRHDLAAARRRAGRRRQLRHDDRARQAHAAAAAGHTASGPRPNGARRGCGAPRSAPGRPSCRRAARPSGPQPGRATQTDAAPGSARPGTRTWLLIDTGATRAGSCPLTVPVRAAGRRLRSLSRASPSRRARTPDLRRPGRFRGHSGGAGTLDPPCNPTPCPSPRSTSPGRFPPGRR